MATDSDRHSTQEIPVILGAARKYLAQKQEEKDELEGPIVALGAALVSLVFSIAAFLLACFVMTKYWGWFVTPIFKIPSPSVFQMYGLAMLVALVRSATFPLKLKDRPRSEQIRRSVKHSLAVAILSLLYWGFGKLLLTFM